MFVYEKFYLKVVELKILRKNTANCGKNALTFQNGNNGNALPTVG